MISYSDKLHQLLNIKKIIDTLSFKFRSESALVIKSLTNIIIWKVKSCKNSMKDVGLSHTGLETSQSLPGNLWLLGKYVHSWTGWQVKEGAAPKKKKKKNLLVIAGIILRSSSLNWESRLVCKHCLIAIYSVSTIVKNMMQTGNAEYSPSK